jgi:hypothetical protein
MLTELLTISEATVTLQDALVPIGFSLLASAVVYLMYQVFYGSSHIGAGVHRFFFIGGPAMTAIFLVIQTSIPLGMGLLGTLSFVRFRTPVKDPAEVGFLLVLIASSIGASTGNYLAVGLLFLVVLLALGGQWLAGKRIPNMGKGHLMVSVDQASFPALEGRLTSFLGQQLNGLSLETMSTLDGRVGLHYQYRRQPGFNGTAFTNELNQRAGVAKVEIFVS